jgi:MauM/NapG family ferredoxin protein
MMARKRKKKPRSRVRVSRRAFLTAAGSGAAATMMLSVSPFVARRTFNPDLIRPPGSLAEEDFLARCIRCGECMKVCPTNAIHPTTLEAGLAGLWSPLLIFSVGYCEFNCTLCGQVCPTGAITELTVEAKQAVHIGTAYVDRTRCLPYANDRQCIVCEEHCPTPKKAIWFREVTVTDREGNSKVLKQPQEDPELCIGCGICEEKCPINDPAAIRVTSAGESRNPGNQFLFEAASSYGD